MLELPNIRFVFFLRTSHQNENKQSAIVLQVIFQKERTDMFTGLYCAEKDWDREAGRVKSSDVKFKTLNENLAMILQGAKNSFDELRFSRQGFTIRELVDKIKGNEDKPTRLIYYLKKRSRAMLKRVGSEIVRATYNKHAKSIIYMQEFLEAEHNLKNLNLQQVEMSFMEVL